MKRKFILLAVAMLTAMFLFGCTEAVAANAPEDDYQITTEYVEPTETVTTTSANATSTSTSTTTSTTTTTKVTTTTTSAAAPQTTTIVEVAAPIVTEAEPVREFIVYKPSTHYVHMSYCRWVSSECYEISDTSGIEARLCTECNPQIEVQSPYIEPTPVVAENTGLSDYEIQLLRKIVSSEYGSDWVSVYEKAKIVAGVMNRVNDSRFPNTIYGVLTQGGQFPGFNPNGNYYMSDSIIQAVDYYFAHPNEFGSYNSWWGDGKTNHFYYQ